jgi:hypothetical protein
VSSHFSVEEIEYLHAWRTDGLSDHSPVLAELESIAVSKHRAHDCEVSHATRPSGGYESAAGALAGAGAASSVASASSSGAGDESGIRKAVDPGWSGLGASVGRRALKVRG